MTLFSLNSKIALGTVQLGLTYGINNQTGKPDRKAAFEILDYANTNGIQVLDSAEAYGDSLKVIGQYLQERQINSFKVISKFISDGTPVKEKVENELANLSVPQLYSYMYHRFSDYKAGKHRNDLLSLKQEKKIATIGVSVYGADELRDVIQDSSIDLIQVPFNPFDASEEKKELLRQAKGSGKEVHVRSVFLQGLFFKRPEALTGNLQSFVGPLREFLSIIRTNNLTPMQACLNYALHQSFIDYVVIGVETREQLVQNLSSVLGAFSENVMQNLELIPVADKRLLNPVHWNP